MFGDLLPFRSLVHSVLVATGIIIVLIYIIYQARFLIVGPQIKLTNDPSMRQHERVVTLTGTASNISHLSLNGQPIFTDPEGTFNTDVILENGYTITTLAAEDRYGRRTTLTREFVYTPMSFTHNQ